MINGHLAYRTGHTPHKVRTKTFVFTIFCDNLRKNRENEKFKKEKKLYLSMFFFRNVQYFGIFCANFCKIRIFYFVKFSRKSSRKHSFSLQPYLDTAWSCKFNAYGLQNHLDSTTLFPFIKQLYNMC